MADNGFHSATGTNHPGIVSTGTKVSATIANGNTNEKNFIAASGLGTTSPNQIPIQVKANRNHNNNPNAASAAQSPLCHCQPTNHPMATSTARSTSAETTSATLRPANNAEGAIGNVRNRSTTPRPTSVTTAIVVLPIPNAIVNTNKPGMRNSR